ncbi:uncharacterized protein LOC129789744 [Lutzomyia longipalpis]|uniref:uncharacterized protein LOC129789744 n=1 Tax=Lutzomyia longipalpis TaxID=7200 RepID=UPI00248421E2|nr:uncharacterized protein LOC129789744 [Lutzomyia longipalpis]
MDLLPSTSKGAEMQYPQDSSVMLKMLNTDCLYTIFSYLNVRELIGIEGVCHRFKEIAEMIYKTYRDLNFDQIYREKRIEKEDVMKIARRVGPNVETITITRCPLPMNRGDVFKLIYKHCRNLNKIILYRFSFHSAIVPDITNAFRNLTVAVLANCDLTDDTLMALLPMHQIEVLSVTHNLRMKGTFLAKLEKIKDIDLSHCKKIDVQMFTDFCVNSPQLQSLNIIKSQSIIRNCLYTIAEKLTNLESLYISDFFQADESSYLVLADLPNMKRLELYNPFDMEHPERARKVNLLEKFLLAVSAHNRLEHLDISETIITDDVKSALANLNKLKILKMADVSHLNDRTLARLSCFNTLQELHVSRSDISVRGLMRVIKLSPLIRYIDMAHCKKFSEEFDEEHIKRILGYLKGRPHVLTIEVDDMNFPPEDFDHMVPLYHPRLKIVYEEEDNFFSYLEDSAESCDSSSNEDFSDDDAMDTDDD